MNTSRKTKIIAEGLALYAAMMDVPMNELGGHSTVLAWETWVGQYPQFEKFVVDQQFKLFDAVNATF